MRIKPGEATYKVTDKGKVEWNVKNKELPELARFYYLQLCGIDNTLAMMRKEIKRLNELVAKLKKRKK